MISQKCQYALRAAFELARQSGHEPVTTAKLAEAEAIPEQFLEVIMGELKQGGFVASKRGRKGGYMLAREPREISVGDIIRFIRGPVAPVACVVGDPREICSFGGECVFLSLWRRAYEAASAVYDSTSLEDLVTQANGDNGHDRGAG